MRPFNMIYDAGGGEREREGAPRRAPRDRWIARGNAQLSLSAPKFRDFGFPEICRFPSLSILSYSTLMNALFSPIDFSFDFYHLFESQVWSYSMNYY